MFKNAVYFNMELQIAFRKDLAARLGQEAAEKLTELAGKVAQDAVKSALESECASLGVTGVTVIPPGPGNAVEARALAHAKEAQAIQELQALLKLMGMDSMAPKKIGFTN